MWSGGDLGQGHWEMQQHSSLNGKALGSVQVFKMGSLNTENYAPRFVHKPQLRQEDDGNRLIFECELAGSPQPNVYWFRGDSQIQEDDRTYVRVQETPNRTFLVVLELNDVVESDAGLYKVKAKNKYGEVAASINLNFSPVDAPTMPQVDGMAPTFTVKPTIQQRNESTLVFHCSIVADPRPTITWFRNGVKVQDDPKFQVKKSQFQRMAYHNETKVMASRRCKMTVVESENKLFYMCCLEILDVEASDAGSYKAVARSSMGEGHATINLNFEEGSDLGHTPKIPDGIPPRFPKKPSIRQEGDNLIMECLLEANPFPEITWYRGEKSIKENKRIRYECATIKKYRYLLTLTIKNPTLADGGLYRCNAFNPCGDSNANIDLNFETGDDDEEEKPQGDIVSDGLPPTFTEKPRIIPNSTGTLVTMKFTVKARPKAEMQWYKGNHKIKEGAKFKSKYTEVGEDEFEIMLEIY
eukprot:maker-scaffold401_size182380-snap-gene-0.14 protein:Tk02142 transcript:maker-scaffold401_size182380-snap-gene-0.14-mRNA-1 annotation:"projectin short variant"